MLELARKLAESDTKFFGGWVLAGVEAHLHGAAQQLANKVLLSRKRRAVLQVLGTGADGAAVKELRVFLVLPQKQLAAKPASGVLPEGALIAGHAFTAGEVRDYVAYTGDENIIHQGERPVVPGLCMAAWLQRELGLRELDWRVSFLAPVYAGDELRVYEQGGCLQAYVGTTNVFAIK